MPRYAYICLAAAAFMVTGCGEGGPDTAALEAAESCYVKLIGGDYEGFVDAMYQPDALPEGYRRQLVDNAKMFVAEQQETHGGIDAVAAVRQQRDTMGHQPVAYAFLLLTYGDSTTEEIVVPMVETAHDGWKMK